MPDGGVRRQDARAGLNQALQQPPRQPGGAQVRRQDDEAAEHMGRFGVERGERRGEDRCRVGYAMGVEQRLVAAEYRRQIPRRRAFGGDIGNARRRYPSGARLQERVADGGAESESARERGEPRPDLPCRDGIVECPVDQRHQVDVAGDASPLPVQPDERQLAGNAPQRRDLPADPATGPAGDVQQDVAPPIHIGRHQDLARHRVVAAERFERGNGVGRLDVGAS